MKLHALTVAVLALVAGCASPVTPPGDGVAPPARALACDLDPCALPAIERGAEPWIAVDPADSKHAVVAAMSTREHPWIATAVTFDGGATWEPGAPSGGLADERGPVGPYNFAADVMLAFAGDAVVLVALAGNSVPGFYCTPVGPCGPGASAGTSRNDLVAWRSTDGGRTFPDGVVVAPAEGARAFAPAGNVALVGAHDREHLAVDSATGRLHVAWSHLTERGSDLLASASDDGGLTWTDPVLVAAGLYGPHAVALGDVVLVGARNGVEGTALVVRSEDGGASWSEPVALGEMPYYSTVPVALWKDGDATRALAAHPAGESQERVLLYASADAGASWGQPVSALPEGAAVKRLPLLALAPATGNGALAAYEADGDAETLAGVAIAIARGTIDGNATRVTGFAADARAAFDYFGLAAGSDGTVMGAWGALADEGFLYAAVARLTR